MKKSGLSSVHVFAKKWQIPMIDHRKVLNFCKKDMLSHKMSVRQEYKRKLKAPYIQVVDHSRKYWPEFVEFKNFPFLDTAVPLPHSPFDTWYKGNANGNTVKAKEGPVQFCGLYKEEYKVLRVHINSAKHRSAAMDDSNYASLDAVIKQGTSWEDFAKSVEKKYNILKDEKAKTKL